MFTAAGSPGAYWRIIALSLSLLLCSCSPQQPAPAPPPKQHAHHVAPPKVEPPVVLAQPDAYLLHLSLAEIALQISTADISASTEDYAVARDYSQQKQNGDIVQPVVILEYTIHGQNGHKRLAIPFSMPHDGDAFPKLEDVMYKLNGLSYSMFDIRLAVITLHPPLPLADEAQQNAVAQRQIADRLDPLIKKALPLPAMAQARLDLQLTRFFMVHRSREPAYLLIENAKQALAADDESDSNGESESSRELSREIEKQESLLHKTMPFTLDF